MPRPIEAFLAAAGLLVLAPVFVLIALVIKLYDGGTVLYRAQRVGKGEKLFTLLKFRTMVANADQLGAAITIWGDSRITPPGRLLRKYKLDELPQLLNVLKGEMSFVGARPEDPRYVALYDDVQKQILAFRPGITSPASLEYRDEAAHLQGENWHQHYVNVILPRKLRMDMDYLRRRTFFSDIKIILRTLGGILYEKTSESPH
jgi:lipopolysaccharide/colanic/teichoic acid biosynthesis glycosyltransferase